MDRLQKNCVLVSASLHGVLAAAFLFGSAFLSPSSKTPDMDVLTVIPDLLVDAPFSGGGNPNVKQAAAPPLQPRPQPPQEQQPAPTPPPQPPKQAKAEPITPEAPRPQKPSGEPDFTQPPKGKRQPTVNPNMTVRKAGPRSKTSDSATDSDADERAATKAAVDARRRVLAGALANIGNVASSSTSVEIPGPGGEAFASYSQVVKSIYTQAWIEPREVEDDSATVKASVTIRRDGTVEDARIIQSSGNAAVDASVSRTLKSVDYVRPFPPGAKEAKRTFTIRFDLKAKRQLG